MTTKAKCTHIIEWTSLVKADGHDLDGTIDVWCSVCGVSGSHQVQPEDILWGDENEEEVVR